jgi:transposase
MKHFLEQAEREHLEAKHKNIRDGLIKDRLKAILARDDGLSYIKIARVLRLDESTVRRYVQEYLDDKKIKPEGGGSDGKLNEHQTTNVINHLKMHVYPSVKGIREFIKNTYGVQYSRQGMTDWLLRHDFVFKQAVGVPAKADPQAQKAFVEEYETLKKSVPPDEPILFCDSFHPTQSTRLARGWIHKGSCAALPTTGSRTRLNITGSIHLNSMHLVTQEFETINSDSFIQHLQKLESSYQNAAVIHLITDQAGYHTSEDVTLFLSISRIKLHLLPPYSPNLNPIERLWNIFHHHVSNNRYYATAAEFKTAARRFFSDVYSRLKSTFSKTINDNFQELPIARQKFCSSVS